MNNYNIKDFGATGDGESLNTDAIQKAVEACHSNGGGMVFIPSGVFVCGTVELKSNITLFLSAGAVLKGSADIGDYKSNGFHHNELGDTLSLLTAIGQDNICICGEGIIDFNGDVFMDYSQVHPHEVPENELSEEQLVQTTVKFLQRPNQPVFFHECNHLRLEGITLKNSPCWTVTASNCSNVKIHHISILNGLRVANSDGIHLCASKDVIITDCVFSCGDDCIAVTGITNWEGVSERIVIANCTMRSRSSAIRLGHVASKVRNVVVSNLIIYETSRGICIFAHNDGWVKNISISNIVMDTHIYAGGWWGNGEPLVICAADSNGIIEGVSVKNVNACSENSILVIGNEKNVRDITLSDWNLKISRGENHKLYGRLLDLAPASKRPSMEGAIPWIYAQDITGLFLENMGIKGESDKDFDYSTKPYFLDVDYITKSNARE